MGHCDLPKTAKNLWQREIFVNTGYIMYMELKISKCYSPYGFQRGSRENPYGFLVSAKLHEDFGFNGGMQSIILLGNWPCLKNFVAL